MAAKTVHRTLTLRSAVSLADFGAANGGPGYLEAVLRLIHERFTSIRERRAFFENQVIEGRNIEQLDNGMTLLHLVAYTPDDQISVVPSAGDQVNADLALLDPPDNAEFLDGELMLLVSENDVAICRSGLNESAFINYVVHLGSELSLPTATLEFQLLKRADIDELEMIRREGIKSVSMNSIAHAASVEASQRETLKQSVLGNTLDELKALIGIEEDIPEDAENLKIEVLLSFDKRKGTELDQRQLAYIAEKMLEEEEESGFVIETLSGRKVRANEVVLSKPVRIEAFGKSVRYKEAWGTLRVFYDELSGRNKALNL